MRDDEIRPARMVQVQEAWDHGFDLIDPDVGGVVEALQRHDPALGVRLGTRNHERAWVIFEKHCPAHPRYETGCADCKRGVSREFVTSRRAWLNRSGTWEGLTHEIVQAVVKVDGQSNRGYNFAAAVEAQNAQAKKAEEDRRIARFSENGEELAHAIRKDLGQRYRGRAFINSKPKELS